MIETGEKQKEKNGTGEKIGQSIDTQQGRESKRACSEKLENI